MRKAEAEVRRTQDMEVSLLVKSFFEAPVEAVLQRMAGAGGRRPSVAELPFTRIRFSKIRRKI